MFYANMGGFVLLYTNERSKVDEKRWLIRSWKTFTWTMHRERRKPTLNVSVTNQVVPQRVLTIKNEKLVL